MFIRCLIAVYCFFAIVYSVPLSFDERELTDDSSEDDTAPLISPSKRDEVPVNYETLGRIIFYLYIYFIFL